MTTRGIGGIFFKSDNPEALRNWYADHLGLPADEYGATLRWRDYEDPEEVGQTVWNPFPDDTEYFSPSESDWMINFRVDDLHAELERLAEEGVEIVGEPEEYEYGNFGWSLDPEGNKIELWEPPADPPFQGDETNETETDASDALTGVFATPPGTTMAASEGHSERAIEKSCTVDLSVSEVWRLWTTGEGLAEWWVPDNHVELRVGGPFELYFMTDAPEGMQGSENCRILSFLPQKMLSFTWNAPPNLPHARPRHTHVVVQFDAISDERTAVELHHLGWPDDAWDEHNAWPETFAYFESAWQRVLQMLADHAAPD